MGSVWNPMNQQTRREFSGMRLCTGFLLKLVVMKDCWLNLTSGRLAATATSCSEGHQVGPFKHSRWLHDSIFLSWFCFSNNICNWFFNQHLNFIFRVLIWSSVWSLCTESDLKKIIFKLSIVVLTSDQQVLMFNKVEYN